MGKKSNAVAVSVHGVILASCANDILRFFAINRSDIYRSKREATLDNNMLRAEVESNQCQTIEELFVDHPITFAVDWKNKQNRSVFFLLA